MADDLKSENVILSSLRKRLVDGTFNPGQRLQPDLIRHDYDCSASALREALFRLASEGLVDFQEQRGFRCPVLSEDLQHELTLMRILLECEGACLSIRYGGFEWEARMTAVHHKLAHIEKHLSKDRRAPTAIHVWSNAELEFHQTLIGECQSATLIQTHSVIYHRFRQQLITRDREFAFVMENIAQHQDILEAALDRDETAIRESITAHLLRNLSKTLPKAVSPA